VRSGVLVPVAESPTLRQTVEYAVEVALEDGGPLLFAYVHGPDLSEEVVDAEVTRQKQLEAGDDLFARVEAWAGEDAGSRADELTVETSHVGTDQYLFSPEDVAQALAAEARAGDTDRIVLDPEYDPGIGTPLLRPLEYELTRYEFLTVEETPAARPTRRTPLLVRSTPVQIGVLFGVAFLFYQALAASLDPFDVVTGAVSAAIVAVGLSRTTFDRDPGRESPVRLARTVVYVPYLLAEIIKANVQVAAVILDPRLPIDPRLTRIRPAVWGGLPVTTLANSITLTPGTLSVRVDGRTLFVHTLIPAAREDLFDGGLERAVRFVFYGVNAMRISSLRERGLTETLQPAPGESAADAEPATDERDPTEGNG